MFRKTIFVLSLVMGALGMTALSTPAAACTDANNPGWDCIHDTAAGTWSTSKSAIQYTGSMTLGHWYPGTHWCDNVSATVDVSISGGTGSIAITNFDMSNSSDADCANWTFHNFNWTGSDSSNPATSEYDTDPTSMQIGTVVIRYNGTTVCNGAVEISISNDGSGGSIMTIKTSMSGWAGSCTVDGTLYSSGYAFH